MKTPPEPVVSPPYIKAASQMNCPYNVIVQRINFLIPRAGGSSAACYL